MRIPLLIIAIVFLLCGRAYALETDEILQSQADALDLDGLQQAAEEYAPEFDWTQTPDLDGGLADLLKTGTESLHSVIQMALHSGLLLLTIVLLASLAEGAAACGTGKTLQAVPVAAALAITAVSVADANTLIGLGKEVIERMELFSKVLRRPWRRPRRPRFTWRRGGTSGSCHVVFRYSHDADQPCFAAAGLCLHCGLHCLCGYWKRGP